MNKSEGNFKKYGMYYEMLYKDKDYQAEVQYVLDKLRSLGIKSGKLLELGSGSGIHARLLSKNGFKVTGIERSDEMIASAPELEDVHLIEADIRKFEISEKFDAVISLFHVISYLNTNQDVADVFSNVARHLKPGGIFLFDFWFSDAVAHQKPEVRVKRISNDSVEVVRIAEPFISPINKLVDVKYTIFYRTNGEELWGSFSEVHSMRHYSLFDLDIVAQKHGFERCGAEEFLSHRDPSVETWGVCVWYRKV
jgi:SAM-dependent methyltransferase